MTAERKNRFHLIAAFSVIIFFFLLLGNNRKSEGKSLDLTDLKLPGVKSFTLNNGINLFYIKDDLPRLTIYAAAGFGRLYETEENAGISEMIETTLSLAGSKNYPSEKLHEKIDSIGGKLSIEASWENTIISITVLKRYKVTAFKILSDLLLNPNFDEKYAEIARSIVIERIRRKKDKPESLAFQKLREIIFDGRGYGSVPTEKGIRSYSVKLMARIWGKYFTGANLLVGISSPDSFSSVKKESKKYLSEIKKGKKEVYHLDRKKIDEIIKKKSSKIYFLPKNIPQSTIVIGTIAPDIHYKGIYDLTLMNYILGGGSFNSMFMKEIRVKKGLAYSVHSIIRFRRNTGIFLGYAQTRNDTAGIVLSLMQDNIKKMHQEMIPEEVLSWARSSIYNSYIFRFDSYLDILSNYLSISYNDLPYDYYLRYPALIKRVSRNEIKDESIKLFQKGVIRVVVGSSKIKDSLSRLGEVVILNDK